MRDHISGLFELITNPERELILANTARVWSSRTPDQRTHNLTLLNCSLGNDLRKVSCWMTVAAANTAVPTPDQFRRSEESRSEDQEQPHYDPFPENGMVIYNDEWIQWSYIKLRAKFALQNLRLMEFPSLDHKVRMNHLNKFHNDNGKSKYFQTLEMLKRNHRQSWPESEHFWQP